MNIVTINQSKGFTLIELIIILAIIGVMFSIAIPSFSQLYANTQQTTQLYTLFNHHMLARSEAIKYTRTVLLCKSSNGKQCTPKARWSDGWIIFSDIDNDKKISNNEQVISIQQALSDDLSLKYKGFGSHNYVRYFPSGHSSTNGTFTLCSQLGDKFAKSVIIARTGRIRIASKATGGEPLSCS